jgi:hypothetical protein
LTRSQRWAQIVSGNYQDRSYSQTVNFIPDNTGAYQLFINKITTVNCPNLGLIPTPTSSSDVPGPITYLIRDESIPLYNYSTNSRSSGIINEKNTEPWQIILANDIYFNSNSENTLFTLYIQPSINSKSYIFDFQTPIGIYISGQVEPSVIQPNIPIRFSNTINISNIALNVYYNDKTVNIQDPTISDLTSSINYDISFIPQLDNNSFSMCVYSGVLNISNLILDTEPGYIYDIKPIFTINNIQDPNVLYTSTIINTKTGVYANLSESNVNIIKNCKITRNPFIVPGQYPSFSFAGN